MALLPRTPWKIGLSLYANVCAPGPPESLNLPSGDLGPLGTAAAQPQLSGTICRLELPSGVLRLKSQGQASHLLWSYQEFYLVGLV